MEINFEKVEIFTNVAHTKCVVDNIKVSFADGIYNTGHGVAAHALALKIFNSKGPQDYDDQECDLIRSFAKCCSPNIIDAINNIIDNGKKENKK